MEIEKLFEHPEEASKNERERASNKGRFMLACMRRAFVLNL